MGGWAEDLGFDRPGTEDPHRREQILLYIIDILPQLFILPEGDSTIKYIVDPSLPIHYANFLCLWPKYI